MEVHVGVESSSSTPYESATCSPRSSTDRAATSYYSVIAPTRDIRSLPASGIGFVTPSSRASLCEETLSEDFDFSARFSETDPPWSPTPMSSADELFCNGQIRPLWYNCEDLGRLSSDCGTELIDDDEDNHFDFRSSADYNFSMFSAAHSPASAMNKPQRYAGHGSDRPSPDECSRYSQGQVTKTGMEDAGDVQRTKRIVQNWRAYSRHTQDEMIARQVMILKVEESRGKCAVEESRGKRACHNKEGGIRRSRSLSPLRVFHMDDEMPKQPLETCGDKQQEVQSTQIASSKGRRLMLRELLHSRSQADKQKRAEEQQNMRYVEREMEKKMEGSAFCFKSPAKKASDSKLKASNNASQHQHQALVSAHGVQYASHRSHAEHMRQQTFLPYRHGLLGCLGFNSKSYRSAAGMRTFQSKSQGTRRSTGYDSVHL